MVLTTRGSQVNASFLVVSFKYGFRIQVHATKESKSLEGVLPSYSHTEPIELTTHSREEVEIIEGSLDGPALGIIGLLWG